MVRRALPCLFLCVALVLVVPTAASAAGSGPVASYSFDEVKAEGGVETVEDLSGNGHTATVEGATSAPGKFGSSLKFNGENSCVSIEPDTQLELTEEFALEAWVKPEGQGLHAVVTQEDKTVAEGEDPFAYTLLSGDEEEEGPRIWVRNPGGERGYAGGPTIPQGAWSHLAVTDDGAYLRFYVNGELSSTQPTVPLTTGDGPLTLGCIAEYGDYFKGRIDEVRIYNRVLSGAEVALDIETPLQTPKAGPVAEWSFDEGKGTTAADLTGHGHTATISKATWTKGRFGDALKFDGKSSCLTVPNSPELDFTEELTLEAWVRPVGKNGEGDPLLVQVDESPGPNEQGYAYDFLAGEKEVPKAWIREAGSGYQGIYGTEPLPEGIWSHVALTDDGANLRLYVDGQLVRTTPAPPLTTGNGPLKIGCDIWNGHFNGRIDEVRLYNRALNTGEVDGDMEAPVQTPKTGPVASYSFDEGSGETVEDLTGNGHTATIQGAEWTTHGRYGGALEFDAANEDFVSIPASTSLDGTEELTVEAWVRPTATPEFGSILMKEREGSGPQYSYALYQHKDQTSGYFQETEEGELISPEHSLPTGTWTHLAVTDDGAYSRLYVNGELVDTEVAVPLGGHGEIRLGGNSIWGEYFDGRIDEVRIYDRGLDAAEVDADMETPLQTPKTGPVASYSFDEDNEETQADTSGNGHTATVEGAKWTSHGRYGGAMEFDGENDQLTIPDSEDLRFSEEFTLEAWVRPSQIKSLMPVIAKTAPGEYGYALYASDGNEPRVPQGFLTEGEYVHGYAYAGHVLDANSWTHLAVTFDGSHIRFFLNGTLVDERSAEDLPIGKGPLTIGGDEPFAEGGFFDGRIDEIRVYDRSLNATEVATDMEAPIQTPQQGPIAAWSFDEIGEGNTVEDLTGDGHNGTVEGATLARGKYGNALQFNGESDVVKVPSSPEFALTEGFTLESWVRPESESNEWAPILAKELTGEEAPNGLAWWLYEGDWNANEPFGGTEPTPGNRDEAHADDPLPVDAWSHVALTYDGAKVRLYINGELVDCSPVPAGAPPVTTGELQIGAATELGTHFKGRLDEVRIYNRSLTEAEIRSGMSMSFPMAKTAPAEDVESNNAILIGSADADGGETEYFFEYGPTEAYGSTIVGEELPAQREVLEIEEAVIELAPETTYHYRLVARSAAGTAHGKDQTFTTGERVLSTEEEEELSESEDETSAQPFSIANKPAPGKFFGMMWTGNYQKMLERHTYSVIERSGAKMVRIFVLPGHKHAIAEAFREAAVNNLEVLPYFGSGPIPRPGSHNESQWLEYAEEVVSEYGPGSKYANPVQYWEVWNEPNMPFPLESPEEREALNEVEERAAEKAEEKEERKDQVVRKPDPEAYAKFLKAMSNAIASGAKEKGQVKILAAGLFGYRHGGCHPECHLTPRKFLMEMNGWLGNNGGVGVYDAVSLHPYVLKVGPAGAQHAPEKANVPAVRGDVKRDIVAVKRIKKVKKPVWVTELGFPVANPGDKGGIPHVTVPVQGELVGKIFEMLSKDRAYLDLDHAFYYNIEDDQKQGWEYHSGLLSENEHARPAWFEFSGLAGGQKCPHEGSC